MHRIAAVLLVFSLASLPGLAAKKKKNEEPPTQTLEALPDPPSALKAEVGRMVFHNSPLTNKGLLSQQVREGIRAIWRLNGGATVVKIRALVAGTGDLRRVQQIVSEMFTEKKLPLPVVSTIQVGGLPTEAAQVVLEATSLSKKIVNPEGLAFISGKGATAPLNADAPHMKVAPLTEKSGTDLKIALSGIGLAPDDVLRVTCFLSSLEDQTESHAIMKRDFPQAALVIAQTQRSPDSHVAECEAIARLKSPSSAAWKVVNPPGLPASPAFSQLAVAGPGRVVITGSQLAFRATDADVRLAFERMKASLEKEGASMKTVFWSSIYPLSKTVAQKVRAIRFEFYDKANPPASTVLLFEGLPSLDATFALELIAGLPQ